MTLIFWMKHSSRCKGILVGCSCLTASSMLVAHSLLTCLPCAQWTAQVAATARAYLFDSAPRFAFELWGFAASGLSLEAHDRATFGMEDRPPTPAMPPAQAAGVPLTRQASLALPAGSALRAISWKSPRLA